MLPTTIDDAYNTVNPDVALPSGDPRYVDLSSVRGGDDLARLLARRLQRSDRGAGRMFLRQLITGHRRCGKTTELFRLKQELENIGSLSSISTPRANSTRPTSAISTCCSLFPRR
jgi:hypothetical protein